MFTQVAFQDDNRVQALNERISNRNQSGQPMNMSFDPRGQSTKYTRFPVFERETTQTQLSPIQCQPYYNPTKNYLPASNAPYSGYALNVDQESRLHNSFMVRQKYGDQSYYIPSTKSDLYNVPVIETEDTALLYGLRNPHGELFRETTGTFSTFDTNPYDIKEKGNFNTHTRQEIKNIPSWVIKGKNEYINYISSEDTLLSTTEINDENGRTVYASNTQSSFPAFETRIK